MKSLTITLPDKIIDHLESLAKYENKSLNHFTGEILILVERELWKTLGPSAEEMLRGLEYYNKHLR